MDSAVECIYGQLPQHWKLLSVGDLVTRGQAELQTGPFGTMLHASSYKLFGTPVVAVKHIGDNKLLHTDDLPRVDDETQQRLSRYELRIGDILFGRKGAVERRALVRADEDGWLQGSDCIRLRLLDTAIDPVYVSYVFGSSAYRSWIIRNAQGATMPSLNQEIISRIPLPVPPLSEQRAIAHILGTLDNKIELNQQMNGTLEAIAQAIFKSWFVDFDPVRAKMDGRQPAGMDAATADLFPDEFEDSPLGKIPKGWRIVQIEDIAARVAMGPFGSRITTDNFFASGVPVIRGSNLVAGFNENEFVYVTSEKADELRSANAFPEDIVFTHRGTLGQVGFIPKSAASPRYVVSQSQMLLSVDKSKISPKFIYRFFHSPSGQQALLANTNTTGVPAIARPSTSLKAIQLVIPPKSISDGFEQLTNYWDSKQELNTQESKTLASIRDILLSKLLSGKIQIKGGVGKRLDDIRIPNVR